VTRVSQGQRLRADLVKQLKRIAVEEDRKLYEVMEEALEQYIERHQQNST
jgi:predicted transcriptional regulator